MKRIQGSNSGGSKRSYPTWVFLIVLLFGAFVLWNITETTRLLSIESHPQPLETGIEGRGVQTTDSLTSHLDEMTNSEISDKSTIMLRGKSKPSSKPNSSSKDSNAFLPSTIDLFKDDTAIGVFCYSRPDMLSQTLTELLNILPKETTMNQAKIMIFILQDGFDQSITVVAEEMSKKFAEYGFSLLHSQMPQLRDDQITLKNKNMFGFAKLSNNYKQQLSYLITQYPSIKRFILLEDDLLVSPDFLVYFSAVAPLLDEDDSLLAASAWNDNGGKGMVSDNTRLYRTDFFSGLGWMIRRDYLEELVAIWPEAFWDDWLRNNKIRKGRQFIVPEMCRTFNIGVKGGTSGGAAMHRRLSKIDANKQFVDFHAMDLDFLRVENYESYFSNFLADAIAVQRSDLRSLFKKKSEEGNFIVYYNNPREFNSIATAVDIMSDIRGGTPRQSYRGHVFTRFMGKGLIIAPSKDYETIRSGTSGSKKRRGEINLNLRSWQEYSL